MKRVIRLTGMLLLVGIIAVSCTSKKPEKTIESLKSAIIGETNANAKYQAFSLKAAEEGYPNIAKMFVAATEAEAIHVKNHNAVLVKLGEDVFHPIAEIPEVSTTEDNLQSAINGETHEFTEMYPGFIPISIEEKVDGAITTYTWAKYAEESHAKLYTQTLEILRETKSDEKVASVWYVCPKCGNLFNDIEGVLHCPVCGDLSETFLEF